jgi:hypothetical protein
MTTSFPHFPTRWLWLVAAAGLILPTGLPAQDWPCWRGTNHNGISMEPLDTGLVITQAWTRNVGTGHGCVSVKDGLAYVMGGDPTVTLYCFDAASGAAKWQYSWDSATPTETSAWGGDGTRCTPAVHDGRVYAICQAGKLYAFDAVSGSVVWGPTQVGTADQEFQSGYGHCGSPVILNGQIWFNGGATGMVVDAAGGSVTGGGQFGACASVVPTPSGSGRLTAYWGGSSDQKVYLSAGGPTIQWVVYWGCLVSEPIVVGDKVFLTSRQDGTHSARYTLSTGVRDWQNTTTAAYCSQCVLLGNRVFGLYGGNLFLINWDTGATISNVTGYAVGGYCEGSLMAVDNKLLVQCGNGDLVIANTNGTVLVRKTGAVGSSYTTPVYANRRIYCRDAVGKVVCLRVGDLARPDSFAAAPSTINATTPSVLSWQTTYATQAEIRPWIGPVSVDGSTSVQPPKTTAYTLYACGPGGPVTTQVTVNVSITDNDADGLPDDWETLYFGGTDNPQGAPAADSDGDGASNLAEYGAGTNPTNPASVLALLDIDCPAAAGPVLSWSSASNRTYAIRSATNLPADFAVGVASNIPAHPPMNVHTAPVDQAASRFYRIVLEP